MKVFLGGTCSGYKWRDALIPMLNCEYYNPIVKNWSEADRLREVHERETADYVLYVITSGMKGVLKGRGSLVDGSQFHSVKVHLHIVYGFTEDVDHSSEGHLSNGDFDG